MKLTVLVLFALRIGIAQAFDGDNPPCELCGCSFCTEGEFPVGNPLGVIPVTEEFLAQFPNDTEGEQTVGDLIESFGLTEIPCQLLDLAASGGAFPPEVCVDDLRLNSFLRNSCGCPPLPSAPSTDPPTAVPTDNPVLSWTRGVLASLVAFVSCLFRFWSC